MTPLTRDLWPADLAVVNLRTPVSILREQAAILGQRTKNLVEAEISTSSSTDSKEDFVHSFVLVAPALDNYRYSLFKVVHSVEAYPVSIVATGFGKLKAHSEEEFVEQLSKIFAAENTKKIIQTLIAQSQE